MADPCQRGCSKVLWSVAPANYLPPGLTLTGAGVLAVAATGALVVLSSAGQATPAAQEAPVNTAAVERGRLSNMVSQFGILTYRARSDGSRYAVINRARGTYTKLPNAGDSGLDDPWWVYHVAQARNADPKNAY